MVRDVTGEVTSISQVSYSVITAISEILIILVTFILFLLYDFKLAIISLCSFSLIFFFIHTIISKKIHSAGTKRVHEERKMYDLATNSFIGVKEIISNELYDYYARTYEGLINERSKACSNQMHLSFIPRIIFEFLIVLCILSMLFYYIVFVGENLSQIITFIAGLTAVSFRVLPGVSRLINSLQTINFNSLTISHYSNLVSQNSKNNFKPIFNSISNDYIISAENIAFSYPKTETIYKIPELIIKPGEIIGIRGESGSGKSTLISIILGLYGTNEGTLSYNKNIKTISDIGYVDQKVQILEDTIFYNVTFSNSYDEESVENFTKVLKMVGLFDFYQKTCLSDPKFQLKMLGENISGGQAQRIGIARALYKKSIFLILDEFTSALDEDNENRLLSLLNEFRNERAILIVSHSNNVLKSCDKTYILKNQILCLQ
jgi:ATP-binding cassette subfamily B protein